MSISYRWNIWSPGQECTVIEYNTGPPSTQRKLEGKDKTDALRLIKQDMQAVSDGAPFGTSKIGEGWYWYNINPSENSPVSGRSRWEVKFDSEGLQVDNPCMVDQIEMPSPPIEPPPPQPPTSFTADFVNATLTYTESGGIGTLTLKGPVQKPGKVC